MERLAKNPVLSPVKIEDVSDSVSNQTVFFISTNNKKKSRIITSISREKYKHKDLCVSAVRGESFIEALKRDGRFKLLDNWTHLVNCKLNHKVAVTTAAHISSDCVFTAEVSSKRVHSSTSGESVSTSDTVEIKKEKREEDEVHYVPSPFPTTPKGTSPPIIINLLGPTILGSGKSRDIIGDELTALLEKNFSKEIDQSKSVQLMDDLVSASKSVGHIYVEDGPDAGTCFLVEKNVILTNYHVYDDIKKILAAGQSNRKVKVAFNYVRPNQAEDLGKVEVDLEKILAQCPTEKLDYIFLELKDDAKQPILGDIISTANPNDFANEFVTIIGHPDGREKQIDTDCRVISQYTWRPELLDRIQKRQSFEFTTEYLNCKRQVMSEFYEHKIAYHSSFLHGASGSPVFNKYGKIIAMHACGWVLEKDGKIYKSIMEFAIPMKAIYDDCYKNCKDVASMLLPNSSMNVD